VNNNMKLTDPLPRKVTVVTRTLGYLLSVVLIGGAWYGAGQVTLAGKYVECFESNGSARVGPVTAMERAKALVGCVDERAGPLQWLAFAPTRSLFRKLPSVPCEYVGTWRSVRNGSVYQVHLAADGEFRAMPADQRASGEVFTGSWSVLDDEAMVWLYEQGRTWPPDINPMSHVEPGRFTLTELHGAETQFTKLTGSTC
jgi:hypothetical protein